MALTTTPLATPIAGSIHDWRNAAIVSSALAPLKCGGLRFDAPSKRLAATAEALSVVKARILAAPTDDLYEADIAQFDDIMNGLDDLIDELTTAAKADAEREDQYAAERAAERDTWSRPYLLADEVAE